jgi:signal transduction histidine kinase
VHRGKDNAVVGVFEIYADVTPLLDQVKLSSEQLERLIAANQGKIEQTAKRDVNIVAGNSSDLLRVVGGLLVLLFVSLLLIVRRGQAIIDSQHAAQERSIAQEHLWHREKMAAMSALAANVSHETGNALTIIAALGQQLADKMDGDSEAAEAADSIQEQSRRIFRMTRQISAFATASDRPEYTSVNPVIEAVCYFFSFDRRFHSPIEFRPGEQLPWCDLIPDFLKEVLMNLLPTLSGRISIETGPCSKGVRIRVRAEPDGKALGPEEQSLKANRMEIVAQRLGDMGGTLAVGEQGALFDIELPAVMREDSPH